MLSKKQKYASLTPCESLWRDQEEETKGKKEKRKKKRMKKRCDPEKDQKSHCNDFSSQN